MGKRMREYSIGAFDEVPSSCLFRVLPSKMIFRVQLFVVLDCHCEGRRIFQSSCQKFLKGNLPIVVKRLQNL